MPLFDIILIDDNPLDIFIASKLIQRLEAPAQVHSFEDAREALDFFSSAPRERKTLVFIDIQMPLMDGFAFVEAFESLQEPYRRYCDLFMLSSSINDLDMDRVKTYAQIRAFIQKPLKQSVLANYLRVYGSDDAK